MRLGYAADLILGRWRIVKHLAVVSESEILRRKPVWDAFSVLFMARDLLAEDYEGVANVFCDSAYSMSQLEAILNEDSAAFSHQSLYVGFFPMVILSKR